jgi:hypothetical protein
MFIMTVIRFPPQAEHFSGGARAGMAMSSGREPRQLAEAERVKRRTKRPTSAASGPEEI